MTTFREPNVFEHAAMYLYNREYASQPQGAIEFYAYILTPGERQAVKRMVAALLDAAEKDGLVKKL